jgi:hypothetical protein
VAEEQGAEGANRVQGLSGLSRTDSLRRSMEASVNGKHVFTFKCFVFNLHWVSTRK